MGIKRHKPEENVAKLRQVEVLIGQGRSIARAVRTIGVTDVTYLRWRVVCADEYERTMTSFALPLRSRPCL